MLYWAGRITHKSRNLINFSSNYCKKHKNVLECKKFEYALLAQLDRALVYGTKGQGFESLTTHQKQI